MNPTDELDKLCRERCDCDYGTTNPPPYLRISAIADKCGVNKEYVIERIKALKGKRSVTEESYEKALKSINRMQTKGGEL